MNSKPYEVSLVEKLRARRRAMRMSQQKVAKKLGMSYMNVSHIERGRRGIKLDTLMKWAQILNLQLEINLLERSKAETNQLTKQ